MSSIETAESAVSSTSAIREHFPALGRLVESETVAYFDGPGGTQVPSAVADACVEYLFHHNANTHWVYPTSAETDAALAHARAVFATLLNARTQEIVFGANMTTLTFHLSRTLGARWQAGDEIVVTELDHHANIDPWKALERERGVVVREVRMEAETGQLDWKHFESLVSGKTRLVAVGAASNALGTINDVPRAVGLARAVGALTFVDAVHYVPHGAVDVRTLDCDFLACSAYKFYGPHVGVLYGKEELLDSLDFPRVTPAPNAAPERAETGTLNHEGIVGAAAAVEWLASLAGDGDLRPRLVSVYEALDGRGRELLRTLWDGLADIDGVTVYGPTPDEPRTPTVAFVVESVYSSETARELSRRGVFASHGDFYAKTVVDRLGLRPGGLVRAGCACYTTAEEVMRLIEGVREIARAR